MAPKSVPNPPPLGFPVPDLPHAVSVQLSRWDDMVDFAQGKQRIRAVQQGGYPRTFLHRAVVCVHEACIEKFGNSNETCFVFPDARYALACQNYLCYPPGGMVGLDIKDVRRLALEFDVAVHHALTESKAVNVARVTMHAVFIPVDKFSKALAFWRLTGCGILSRQAEDMVERVDTMSVSTSSNLHAAPLTAPIPINQKANKIIRNRIASLLNRAAIGDSRSVNVSAADVYLYPSGMSAIYNLTQALRGWPGTQTVVFGFPYELTLKTQQDFAKNCTFYGLGTPEELRQFEVSLSELASQGEMIQSVWCECASNPLLRTVDLNRIYQLADQYGFVVVVDDTIGSFANVDVLNVSDVVVTSLTKSFSGFADVMGGSIALNPASRFYQQLQAALSAQYRNCLYSADAVKLEANSRGFLPRAAIMNRNASHLVSILGPLCRSIVADSPLEHLYYPSCCWSAENYRSRMRQPTDDFVPGYGGLFTMQFRDVVVASAFFDSLEVCKGPSLGAHVTLAQPYVQTVFANEKAWAAKYGLNEAIVRISVGIEDAMALERVFLKAMNVAQSAVEKT
ncbi:hypothetical protein QQS21_004371 [Conoideocrella luteorostrata]|uniref:Cystathionine gamma-synthase n=1 Tax=Conoideocrella luteorostrata TaxID=1105319 RepID=A0AAJ0CTX0_9HYPO|nr:hypothetical protein QQS21_004371 [Conoideocrella luteorostrata]